MNIDNSVKSIYLMGICGTAMASLAGMLKKMGYEVRGSDQNVYPPMSDMLKELSIEVRESYRPENLEPRPDLVIVGNVMSKGHPEVDALLASDIPYTSLASCIGENIIADRDSYVVAGTHGKSTTTSLMAWVWDYLGLKPGFMVGAIPANFDFSFRAPEGDNFVIEGDEYDTAFFDKVPKFKHYKSKYTILSSIEFDHADIYKNLTEVKDAFTMLLDKIPEDGVLIYKHGDQNIMSIGGAINVPAFSYGENGDYKYSNVAVKGDYTNFDVSFKGKHIATISSPLIGDFNIWNVLSVVAMAHQRGFDLEKCAEAIKAFKGLKRRQELIYDKNDIKIFEDFAHHPTAVSLCVKALKERYPKSRLVCFFEPRSATSRRNIFQQQYPEAFDFADKIFIKKASHQTAIPEAERFSSWELVEDLNFDEDRAFLFEDTDEIVADLAPMLKKGDRVLIMSNGAFDEIYQKLPRALDNL